MRETTDTPIDNIAAVSSLSTLLASYRLFKKCNYQIAFRLHPSEDGDFKLLQKTSPRQNKRVFSIDYHPIFFPEKNQRQLALHYDRGHSAREICKHRPHQGAS